MTKRIFLILFVLLAACREAEPTPTAVSVTEQAATAVPEAADTPDTPITPTPEPSPTPISPQISALDQDLTEDGRVVISRVVAVEPGWVVIHATDKDGVPGAVLGWTAVAAGTSTDVAVDIDPLTATSTLAAMLHVDKGQSGEFEFPGEDEAVMVNDTAVSDPFAVTLAFTLPAITVSDKALNETGEFLVESAYVPDGGWLVIHADDNGTIGPALGVAYLEPGLSENIPVKIPWREGTPTLYAVLYEDNGRTRRLDLNDADMPILVNGKPVVAEFSATYPPDLFVLDQPVIDDTFVVERVLVNQPSFIVAYADSDGEPGFIIGSQSIPAGLSEQVTVEVAGSQVTDVVYIYLHEDTEPGGGFDFPANDPPLTFEGRLPEPYSFRTNPGNYLLAADQALTETADGETAVTVPLAVVDVAAWLAVHTDDNGQPGDVIGFVPLSPGINRDLTVVVDETAVTDTLYAVLHLDGGTRGEFDFPGDDIILQSNRNPIAAPFVVKPND